MARLLKSWAEIRVRSPVSPNAESPTPVLHRTPVRPKPRRGRRPAGCSGEYPRPRRREPPSPPSRIVGAFAPRPSPYRPHRNLAGDQAPVCFASSPFPLAAACGATKARGAASRDVCRLSASGVIMLGSQPCVKSGLPRGCARSRRNMCDACALPVAEPGAPARIVGIFLSSLRARPSRARFCTARRGEINSSNASPADRWFSSAIRVACPAAPSSVIPPDHGTMFALHQADAPASERPRWSAAGAPAAIPFLRQRRPRRLQLAGPRRMTAGDVPLPAATTICPRSFHRRQSDALDRDGTGQAAPVLFADPLWALPMPTAARWRRRTAGVRSRRRRADGNGGAAHPDRP